MSTNKHIDRICCVVLAVTLLLTVLFFNGKSLGITEVSAAVGYESKLFDTSTVHTIDIVMDDWDAFLETCTNEEYSACTVIIDEEVYKNVAIRAKGNTSLTQVASYGNDRYSFKIEFDHYDNSGSYYGLDKLCLNNIIQDNTYMKDYLTYQMMGAFGVASPLCSYAYITVNGEDWGLYLAVEGIEEAFLQRNYGQDYGELYKPDSQSMGGGRGNGKKFEMDKMEDFFGGSGDETDADDMGQMFGGKGENRMELPTGNMESGMEPFVENAETGMEAFAEDAESGVEPPSGGRMQQGMADGGGVMSMGSDDVKLVYTDDEYDSYSNIFDNAKTDITDSDKDRLIASLKSLNANENIEDVVDVESVIRYFVVHNFVLNFDSYTGSMIHNYYLYEKDGQMAMIPWDYNLAFGGFQSESDATTLVNYPMDSPVSGGTTDSRPMLNWIFEKEEYTELYHQYFSEFISEYFDSGYFSEMIDKVKAMISPYVEKDPTKFCTYEDFETGIDTLKEFCFLRAESIRGQLDGTIASTSEEQTQNSDALISAENISVSDMGSMNNGMGRGGKMQMGETADVFSETASDLGDGNDRAGVPGMDGTGREERGGEKLSVDSTENSEQAEEAPDMGNFDGGKGMGGMPESEGFDSEAHMSNIENMSQMPEGNQSAGGWILLGISVVFLIGGLLFAFLYR